MKDRQGAIHIAAILLIVVLILAVVAIGFVLGWFNRAVGDDCPPGECDVGEDRFSIRLRVTGHAHNPTFGPLSVDIHTFSGEKATPGLSFGRLAFWTVNYEVWAEFLVTYPSGNTFSFDTDPVSGSVQGGKESSYDIEHYIEGPAGGYRASVTMHIQEKGIIGGVHDTATETVQFTIAG